MEAFKNCKVWSIVLIVAFIVASCSSSDEDATDDMTLSTVGLTLLASPRSGPSGFGPTDLLCFSINYPITVILPDGTPQEFNSEEELQTFIEVWLEDRGDELEQPMLVYPISVETEEGTEDINSDDEFVDLFERCFGGLFECLQNIDPDDLETLCFDVVFPIEVVCADGTIETISGLDQETACGIQEIEDLLGSELELVYPIDIERPDGTTNTINSDEEFQAHFITCFQEVFADCG